MWLINVASLEGVQTQLGGVTTAQYQVKLLNAPGTRHTQVGEQPARTPPPLGALETVPSSLL